MNFVAEQNAYYVSVESQVSINFILVQCDTNVQLVDIERNLAILSIVDSGKVRFLYGICLIKNLKTLKRLFAR